MRAVAQFIHTDFISKGHPSPLRLPFGKTKVLDMGMAPGGFLESILEINRDVLDLSVKAITLPHDLGGHKILLQRYRSGNKEAQVPTERDDYQVALGERQSVDTRQFDITMLAGDLGMSKLPISHPHRPEKESFLPPQPFLKGPFDLVVCGCQLVRSLDRIVGPKHIEKVRNFTSQLAIGLDRLAEDGTMIVLIHNLGAWHNLHMIWRFRQFSDHVDVVKPDTVNTRFCTAYMIAQRVHKTHPEHARAVKRWRDEWETAMFQTEEEYVRKFVSEDEALAETVLAEIGLDVQEWGQRIWRIQADAWKRDFDRLQ